MTATDPDIDELVALAVDAARRAAEVHRSGLAHPQVYERKSSSTDLVSDVDREAERVIVARIRSDRPDDGILAEELTDQPGSTGVRWVIDPLDGTVNYSRGYPLYAVSIGIEIDHVPTIGVVLDTARDRLFVGIRGRGATRDGHPIRVSRHSDLSTAVVATGFSYVRDRRAAQAKTLAALLPRIANTRCDGSAALDLCAVACGGVDAYFEDEVAPWDVAAGRVIAAEAGAEVRIQDADGRTLVLAAAPGLAEALVTVLAETGVLLTTP